MRYLAVLLVVAALAAGTNGTSARAQTSGVHCVRITQVHLRCDVPAVRIIKINGHLRGNAAVTMVLFVGCAGGPALKNTITLHRSFYLPINSNHPGSTATAFGRFGHEFAVALKRSSGNCQVDVSFRLHGSSYRFNSGLWVQGS
jgi:hypothetical protein